MEVKMHGWVRIEIPADAGLDPLELKNRCDRLWLSAGCPSDAALFSSRSSLITKNEYIYLSPRMTAICLPLLLEYHTSQCAPPLLSEAYLLLGDQGNVEKLLSNNS
jgi:hypothetical protein